MIDHPIHFSEAEEMMSSRMDAPTAEKYEQIMQNWSQAARQRAFFSARVADATILSELHQTVQRVVNGEMTQKQAVRILRERFAGPDADALGRMGFMPKRDAYGVSELASIPRLNLIISTNVRMAQECGHFQQWERVKDMYPFGIWHCGFAEEHRPEHLARDGKMYPFEHPIWRESPPGGEFNCHCWRENTTKAAADSKGLVPEDMSSEFVPSSLGFDPSQPLDGDTVKPGKRVLPELAEKAKSTPVPDDVLQDMDAQRSAVEDAKESVKDRCERLISEIPGCEKSDFDGWDNEKDIAAVTEQLLNLSNKYDLDVTFRKFIVEPIDEGNGRLIGGITYFDKESNGDNRGKLSLNSMVLKKVDELRKNGDFNLLTGKYENIGCVLYKNQEALNIATHEFAHRIIDNMRQNGELDAVKKYISSVYAQNLKKGDIEGRISEYAKSSWEEFFAECFSMNETGHGHDLPYDVQGMVNNVCGLCRRENPMTKDRFAFIVKNFSKEYDTLKKKGLGLDQFGMRHLDMSLIGDIKPVIPENIEEIANVLDLCEKSLNEGLELPTFDNIPLGKLLPVHQKIADLNLQDYNVYLSSPGSKDYGIKHWKKHHSDTINSREAIAILAGTLWNPQAEIWKSTSGDKTRLALAYGNDKISLANMYLKKNDDKSILKINLVDLWYPSKAYIEKWKNKNTK